MVNEWEEQRLEDCMDAIIDYRGKTPKKTDCGIPLITAKIIKKGRILPVSEYIAEEDYDAWMRRGIPLPGDVVLTTEAPLGEVAQLDGRKIALAQRVITLRGKENVLDNTYLKYLLMSHEVQHQLDGRGSGTTVKGIKQSELREVMLTIPELGEQKAIAHVLGMLDDRIELSRRMNETLESMAQALFKSWFVDFDPVIDNALAGGKEIPESLSEKAQARAALGDKRRPLPEEIRTLFPDELTYNDELGWVPKGWEVKPIDEAIEVNPRVQLKKGDVAKFVDMKALPTSGFSVADVITKPYSGGAKYNNGDVLLARITPCLENGKTGVVDFLDDGEVGFGSTEFIVLRGKGEIYTPFVACFARHTNFRDHCTQSMVGSSGRQRVQNACFSYFYLAFPPRNDLLLSFNDLAEGTFEKYIQQREESKVLAKLRGTLLPKLLSGELRIPDAEKMVKELAL